MSTTGSHAHTCLNHNIQMNSYNGLATNDVIVVVAPCERMRIPHKPEVNEVSVTLAIQPDGSEPDEAQTLAVSVEPTTRKWIVYDVLALAAKATLFKIVVVPLTFF